MPHNEPVPHVGCVGATGAAAGCGQVAVIDGQAQTAPQADSPGAGCAVNLASDGGSSQTTPPQTVREFERALRGLGFTRLQATSIARLGFTGATAPAEPEPAPGDSEHDLREALRALARSIESTSS